MITPITLPSFDLLEPVISKEALQIHYTQYYLKYVERVNEFYQSHSWVSNTDTLEDLILILDPNQGPYNNASQVWNHEFFFTQFTRNKNTQIGKKFERILNTSRYKSIQNFIDNCIRISSLHFGSGYLWVYLDEDRRLVVETGNNAENLVKRRRCIPILCIDLWEHSYYSNYYSDRALYVEKILIQIDWNIIETRLWKVE